MSATPPVPQSLPQPQYVRLHDGRALAYLDVGPRDAPPVVHFRGIPCSRLEALWEADSCRALGVRVICPDRPGYGLSDHLPRQVAARLAGRRRRASPTPWGWVVSAWWVCRAVGRTRWRAPSRCPIG